MTASVKAGAKRPNSDKPRVVVPPAGERFNKANRRAGRMPSQLRILRLDLFEHAMAGYSIAPRLG